jgi:S-adenosylmethionine synthetase family protein
MAVRDIGYEQEGFHWRNAAVECHHLHAQSADVAQGVDALGNKDEGAGDQGIMFGYACTKTPELMPAPLHYAHEILRRMSELHRADDPRAVASRSRRPSVPRPPMATVPIGRGVEPVPPLPIRGRQRRHGRRALGPLHHRPGEGQEENGSKPIPASRITPARFGVSALGRAAHASTDRPLPR